MSDSGWIGVDLDGTLAHYDGWKSIEHIGDPILVMVDRVKGWISEGKKVKIFTARMYRKVQASETGDMVAAWEANVVEARIRDWLGKVGLPENLDITCVKDFGMIALYDDRCVQVETNTGRLIQ